LFDTGLHEGLKKASRTLEKLLAYVNNVTLQTLFAKLVNDETESDNFHLLSYIVQHEDRINLMQLLTTLFNFIKEETARNPNLNLAGFINTIDLMQKESLSIPMTQVSGTDKGINLLTAHGSKGLEYEYVFVAGCSAGNWEKKRKPGGGYKLPDTMLSTGSSGQELEELRRLFYVAITRAEQGLVLSYTQYNNAGKEQEPSIFIAEIQEKHQLPVQAITPTAEELFAYQQLQLTGRAPEIEKAEEDFISHALDKFVMNVTALNNYLKCPLEFYYKNLIRIPSGKSEALEFGSAIHHALEQLFKKMLDNGKEFAPVEILVEDFKWYMRRHRENFTKDAFNRRMEYGEQILADYYQTYVQQFNKIVTIERNIQSVVVDGVPLKGKLDKLEFDKTAVNVVDYKTGDIEKALPKMKGPDENNPNGGDYWRQAVFYKILVDNYEAKDWKVVSTEFDFVEPNTKTKEYRKEKIVISPADITTVSQQIKTVWQQIQERNFYTGCGKSDCHWCNFVKDNNLAVALHDMETGGEE
jgi:DNA helicase II / ATP-dependent DNA helicase PcrA